MPEKWGGQADFFSYQAPYLCDLCKHSTIKEKSLIIIFDVSNFGMKNSILGIFSYSNNLDGTKWKITSSENHFTQMISMKKTIW